MRERFGAKQNVADGAEYYLQQLKYPAGPHYLATPVGCSKFCGWGRAKLTLTPVMLRQLYLYFRQSEIITLCLNKNAPTLKLCRPTACQKWRVLIETQCTSYISRVTCLLAYEKRGQLWTNQNSGAERPPGPP